MPNLDFVILVFAGFFAGFLKTVASSGTVITMPVLIFLGIDPLIANGTNRIPVFFGFLTSSIAFAKSGKIPWKPTFHLSIPLAIGAFGGALFIGNLPSKYSEILVICALIISLILVLLNPKRFLNQEGLNTEKIQLKTILIGLLIGIWAGIFVLDSALFILFLLVIQLKYNLLQANAMKSVLILVISVVSLGVFFIKGEIDWSAG